jgi:hypothetical protein
MILFQIIVIFFIFLILFKNGCFAPIKDSDICKEKKNGFLIKIFNKLLANPRLTFLLFLNYSLRNLD